MLDLRNETMADRELLHAINDVADAESGVTFAHDLALHLGVSSNGEPDLRPVARRLSWATRYGYVERIDPKTLGEVARWGKRLRPGYVITDEGRALMNGNLSKALTRELGKDRPGTRLLVMRELADRSYVHGGVAEANAVRREWLHRAARRSR